MPTADEKSKRHWVSERRIVLVARMTLAEALHSRVAVLLGLVGGGLILLGLALRHFNFGSAELRFLIDFGFSGMSLALMTLAALATAQLHFDELTRGSATIVLTRAVRRSEYLAGRLLGVLTLLGGFAFMLTAVLALVVAVRARQLGPPAVSLVGFAQAGGLLWFKASLVAAMTLLICTYASSALFAIGVGLLMTLVAHLRPFGPDSGGFRLLRLWPDLTRFDADGVLAGAGFTFLQWAALVGYWAAFLAAFWGLAVYVFRRQEF